MRDLRYEVWSEDDWEEGISHCLGRLADLGGGLNGPVLLDLGCGIGRLADPIADTCPDWHLIAVDTDPEMIEAAPRRANIIYQVCEDGMLDLPDDLVDTAYSVLVFQHLPDSAVRRYLSEVRRVLKEDGWFLFQFVVGDEQADYHYQRSRDQVAVWCAKAGFKTVGTSGDARFPTWCWVEAR